MKLAVVLWNFVDPPALFSVSILSGGVQEEVDQQMTQAFVTTD